MRDLGRSRASLGDLEVALCCEVLVEEWWVEDEPNWTWVGGRERMRCHFPSLMNHYALGLILPLIHTPFHTRSSLHIL